MSALDHRTLAMHHGGAGAPLVLLHCLGVDHRFWDFARVLENEFTIWRYDLPGHGATPVPDQPYGIEDLSAQLAGLFAFHQIGRAHVAGISLGGLVAQHFAASHPDLVDRLVLIDTTPRYSDERRTMWAARAAAARAHGVASLVDGLLQVWFSAAAIAQNGPGVRYVREALTRCSGEGYARGCEALAAADVSEHAALIAAPTMVVCGNNDIPSFLEAACWLASIVRDARLEWIPDTRHASVLEKPEDALERMRAFLG
jgi:3-oxoadipate enol-lactonase